MDFSVDYLRVRVRQISNAVTILTLAAAAHSSWPQASKPADYSAESLVIEKAETTYRYNEDGTGEKLSSLRIRLQSEAGTRQFSVIAVPFASSTEKPSIERLVVQHGDGSMTETPASDAIEMPAPVSQQAPLYSDLKVLQVPVRGLRAGDILEYSVRVDRKNPEAASQFWDAYHFAKDYVSLSETLTLDVPSSKYVQQWSASEKPIVTEKAGRKVFVWHASQLKPTSSGNKKEQDDSDAGKAGTVDVAWSTFHSWAEVGEWYRSLESPRAVPNDSIRAQAEEITRNAKSPSEQVAALYAFVSSHIRYVGIDFGVGRYQPHPAAEVLAMRYGDCKDKDTLFEALLRAKGFTSSPALIGVNIELVPELPSPGFFNHVVTTIDLPAGRIWADTTPGVAPLEMLLSPLRDKQVLVIPPQGAAALVRTPANPPFPLKDQFEAEATLNKDGELTGKVNITFRSDNEVLVRAIGLNLAPAQWDQGTQLVANGLGFSGTVSNSQFDHPEDVTQPVHLHYDYSKKPYGDWDNFRIIPLLPINTLPQAPEKKPLKDVDLGAPRAETAVTRIHLPAGFGADLPDAVHAKSPFGSVDKTYRLEKGDLIVERQIVVTKSKVPMSSWEEYAKFAKDSSLADEVWIQLTSQNAGEGGPHPPKPGENNPAAAALIQEAVNLERRRDWQTALQKLDEAKKLSSEQPFLWSNYGFLAMVQNRPDEATNDFRHELAQHPEETFVVTLFAGHLMRQSHMDDARSVLKSSFDRNPEEPQVAAMLASLQADNDLDQAIATLHKAIGVNPKETRLMSQLVPLLVRKGENGEATQLAGKLLDSAGDDPNLLNDAAYVAAEAGEDTALTEKAARRALDILDRETAGALVGEANQQSFMRSSLITATWDTLGYILAQEKKTDEALDFLEAAWRNRPEVTVGLHYGLALEAAGKKGEALRVYSLSASEFHGSALNRNPDFDPLQKRMAALKKEGIRLPAVGSKEMSLQEERTFKLSLSSTCKSYESATFRLALSASGAPDVLQVGGQVIPGDATESLKKLKLPRLVPSVSGAKLLRDAVVACSANQTTATVVLMPLGGISAENAGR